MTFHDILCVVIANLVVDAIEEAIKRLVKFIKTHINKK